MIERVAISAVVIGTIAFAAYRWLLENGYSLEEARNSILLLMVLFENVHVFNSRSEQRSAFMHNPLRNPLPLFGTMAVQLLHVGVMYIPPFQAILGVQPVSLDHWASLPALALVLLLVNEAYKFLRRIVRLK